MNCNPETTLKNVVACPVPPSLPNGNLLTPLLYVAASEEKITEAIERFSIAIRESFELN